MKIQSEIIYSKSMMAHLTSFEFCPVFDKNRAKVRLCVCSGVLVTVHMVTIDFRDGHVTYGQYT